MPSPLLLEKKNFKRLTWKNGLGFTDEIAIHPEGADLRKGDFLWRISSARIEQASPFSVFPNHDRFLVVLSGGGVRLTHTFVEGEEEGVDVPLFYPYEFPGDVPSRCELTAGPITDLSVFIRKGEVEALVETANAEAQEIFSWVPAGRWNFAVVVDGTFEYGGKTLSPGDALSLSVDNPGETSIDLTAQMKPGKIVTISLHEN